MVPGHRRGSRAFIAFSTECISGRHAVGSGARLISIDRGGFRLLKFVEVVRGTLLIWASARVLFDSATPSVSNGARWQLGLKWGARNLTENLAIPVRPPRDRHQFNAGRRSCRTLQSPIAAAVFVWQQNAPGGVDLSPVMRCRP